MTTPTKFYPSASARLPIMRVKPVIAGTPTTLTYVDVSTMTLVLQEVRDLKAELRRLAADVEQLKSVSALPTIAIRDLSDEQAKSEIKNYFEAHDGEVVYPSDVADDLALDYDTVVRLIGELEGDGKVAKA